MIPIGKPLTRRRPPWCWWSDTRPVHRLVPHSGKPSHTTGPRTKPRAAVHWGVARLCRSWRWRPRSGCWSWAGAWKDWEGCPAKPQMSSLGEMELGGSKSPARAKIKQPRSVLFSVLYCKTFDLSATKKKKTIHPLQNSEKIRHTVDTGNNKRTVTGQKVLIGADKSSSIFQQNDMNAVMLPNNKWALEAELGSGESPD